MNWTTKTTQNLDRYSLFMNNMWLGKGRALYLLHCLNKTECGKEKTNYSTDRKSQCAKLNKFTLSSLAWIQKWNNGWQVTLVSSNTPIIQTNFITLWVFDFSRVYCISISICELCLYLYFTVLIWH